MSGAAGRSRAGTLGRASTIGRLRSGVLDRALAAAIARAGAPGRIRFTSQQLYYELCRVLDPLHAAPRLPMFTRPPAVSHATYLSALAALRRRGEVPGLLAAPAPRPAATLARHAAEPDVFDYGLPRILVCQHRGIAAMLHANDLPMESACPVFALADLPPDPRLVAALARAGDATVYVLHDASPTGMAVPDQVRERVDPPEGVRVVALGLRPRHAAALHLTAGRGPLDAPADSPHGLDPWERRWLADGRFAQVAAVNPARLLRTVHRLVRGVRRPRRTLPDLGRARAAGFLTWPQP